MPRQDFYYILYNNSVFVQYLVSVGFCRICSIIALYLLHYCSVSAPLLLFILSFQLAFYLLYSRCTSGIILSSPLHLEHWWSGYLCPIILQYLVSSPSEINPFFIARAVDCFSGLSSVNIHCLTSSISACLSSFEFEYIIWWSLE